MSRVMLSQKNEESNALLDLISSEMPTAQQQTNEKRAAIEQACERADLPGLVQLADSSGGLLDDQLRKLAWPILLGCAEKGDQASNSVPDWRSLPSHPDEEQVQKDVDRAFVYYPNGESQKAMDARKAKLYGLIVRTLRSYPLLCYFQGYHDIVQVLLLVLNEDRAIDPVSRLSLLRIRDYMLPSLSPALKHLELLPIILRSVDPELANHISLTRPIFALASTITLYAHEIQNYSDIARLFDFILAHEPVIAIYLFAAIIISRRSEVLEIPIDEPDILHVTLSKLPQPLDLELFIERTLTLFKSHPPSKLPGFVWWRISSLSVLKTSRNIGKAQKMEDAVVLFQRQARRLAQEEWIRRGLLVIIQNRRPITSVAAALLVGAISVYLRRSGNDKVVYSVFWRLWSLFRAR